MAGYGYNNRRGLGLGEEYDPTMRQGGRMERGPYTGGARYQTVRDSTGRSDGYSGVDDQEQADDQYWRDKTGDGHEDDFEAMYDSWMDMTGDGHEPDDEWRSKWERILKQRGYADDEIQQRFDDMDKALGYSAPEDRRSEGEATFQNAGYDEQGYYPDWIDESAGADDERRKKLKWSFRAGRDNSHPITGEDEWYQSGGDNPHWPADGSSGRYGKAPIPDQERGRAWGEGRQQRAQRQKHVPKKKSWW